MRVVRVCGYDSSICERYPIETDEKGNIKEVKLECTLRECEHCYFMGEPWARIELKYDKY